MKKILNKLFPWRNVPDGHMIVIPGKEVMDRLFSGETVENRFTCRKTKGGEEKVVLVTYKVV